MIVLLVIVLLFGGKVCIEHSVILNIDSLKSPENITSQNHFSGEQIFLAEFSESRLVFSVQQPFLITFFAADGKGFGTLALDWVLRETFRDPNVNYFIMIFSIFKLYDCS